jgi:hypothetical protein
MVAEGARRLPAETPPEPKVIILPVIVSVTINVPLDADTCVPSSNLIVE